MDFSLPVSLKWDRFTIALKSSFKIDALLFKFFTKVPAVLDSNLQTTVLNWKKANGQQNNFGPVLSMPS